MKLILNLFLLSLFAISATGCLSLSKGPSRISPSRSIVTEYSLPVSEPPSLTRDSITNSIVKIGELELENVVRALDQKPSNADTEFKVCIKTAMIDIDVDDIDSCSTELTNLVKTFKGDVVGNYNSSENYCTLNLKIPSQSLDKFIDKIKDKYDITSMDVESKDVTESYVDTASRLKTQKALLKRLQNLLSRAQKVKEVLEIEHEIGRIQSDIESKENMLKTLSSRASMSGVEIHIDRKKILGPLGAIYAGAEWFFEKLFIIQG